ncbi:hypothetical protein L6R52_23565 [Myxococcota bacterium]|nr:hypothetical protein [Myxococcota bacterium]
MRHRRSAARRRGFMAWMVLAAVLGLSIVAAIGLDRRADDVAFAARTLCRVQAHAAAESGLARLLARLDGGGAASIDGALPGTDHRVSARYVARFERTATGGRIHAEGVCTTRDAAELVKVIDADVASSGGRWSITRWSEGPPAP